MQVKNVPTDPEGNVPIKQLVQVPSIRKYISKDKVEQLALKIYRISGRGIGFPDLEREFGSSKEQAQRILKNCCKQWMDKRGELRRPILFRASRRSSPQEYFPTCIKADIVEDLKKRDNVPKDPTEVSLFSKGLPTNALATERAQHLLDLLLQTAFAPLCVHKIQLQLHIVPEGYDDTKLNPQTKNKAKVHEERIGQVKNSPNVKYYLYPSGKVMVYVECSQNPFKLDNDTDVSLLFAFFGQVRDRLLYLLSDVRERIVPSIMDWYLIQCDVNRDIEINDNMQLTLPDVQLKFADRVFRLYVKSLHEKACYRAEEAVKLNLPIPEALDNIRHPCKNLENKVEELINRLGKCNCNNLDINNDKKEQQVENN